MRCLPRAKSKSKFDCSKPMHKQESMDPRKHLETKWTCGVALGFAMPL